MHPTVNTVILRALRERRVTPRVGIERVDGHRVYFRDGASEDFDTMLWATAFRIAFPSRDDGIVNWDTAKTPPLYLKMMHQHLTSLFFIGLFQPLGCIWRLADHQARIA